MTSIVWFRDDLRLADHPALRAAISRDEPVLGVYILDEESPGVRPLGGAAKWWLHHSLESLSQRLSERDGALVLRRGRAGDVLSRLVAETGADAVFWNRRYAGPERHIDTELKRALRDSGVTVESYAGSLLFEPWTVTTGSGDPYSVFTPFWKACLRKPHPRAPRPEPREVSAPRTRVPGDLLDEWRLLPRRPDWAGGLRETWTPGEPAARKRLESFLADDVIDYDDARDEPASDVTSRLSPHLRWGEISPYTVWHDAVASGGAIEGFLSEIGWREFAWHTLYRHPDLATKNLDRRFDDFPWPRVKPTRLRAWQQGRTGYALVDAGMRELWYSGTMHNRVRMVAASFLVKNLLIDWRRGEQWFWDTLVDADMASNPFNWQWVAGSGADAAPYFRVFNPELQAEKFDPHGEYVRRWAPDHADDDGPEAIVDLRRSRREALDAFDAVKNR